jgi:bifunctional DNA-binding transcriptional regulator/antitoxin component of YhaV-PrlF toxin-antitoxin module
MNDGYRITIPYTTREKYNIREGDYVTVKIKKQQEAIFTAKVSSKGLIAIPQKIVKKLAILPNDVIDVSLLECYHPPTVILNE